MSRRTNVTIRDIAKMTGVSKTTVSRYVNGKLEFISESTRLKIKDAIEKTGYRPNRIAGSLKASKSNLIGLVLVSGFVMRTPIFMANICEYCRKYGIKVIVVTSGDDPLEEQEQVQELLAQQVEGLIVATGRNIEFYEQLNAEILPVVLLDPPMQEIKTDWVSCNQYDSVFSLAEKLIDQGYEKLHLVLTSENSRLPLTEIRKKAIQDAYYKHFKNDSNFKIVVLENAIQEQAENEISSYLSKIYEESEAIPTAIFVANGMIMGRFIFQCYRQGLRFSSKFTIAGYDLLNYGRYHGEELITIKQPLAQMAEKAAELLISRILEKDDDLKPRHIMLECDISI